MSDNVKKSAPIVDMEKIRAGLTSSKSVERASAAAKVGRHQLKDLGPQLLQALIYERSHAQAWKAQINMLDALVIIDYKPALPFVKNLCDANHPLETVTKVAAEAYVRLSRTSLTDVKPVLALLAFGKHAVRTGCLNVLGYDRMRPADADIRAILAIVKKRPIVSELGLHEPRYGLAAACAGWQPELVHDFLQTCLLSDNAELRDVAQNALQQKYVKLNNGSKKMMYNLPDVDA